jgi:hypothetical protein
MKTLKSIVLGLALLVVGTIANAANKPTAVLTKNDVLNIYVNAVVHGKLDGLEGVLDNNVKFITQRGDNEVVMNKKTVLESFKASENMEQGCTYTTTIVKDTKNGMIVKLEMKYGDYVRTNLITISTSHDDFKITKVENQA